MGQLGGLHLESSELMTSALVCESGVRSSLVARRQAAGERGFSVSVRFTTLRGGEFGRCFRSAPVVKRDHHGRPNQVSMSAFIRRHLHTHMRASISQREIETHTGFDTSQAD